MKLTVCVSHKTGMYSIRNEDSKFWTGAMLNEWIKEPTKDGDRPIWESTKKVTEEIALQLENNPERIHKMYIPMEIDFAPYKEQKELDVGGLQDQVSSMLDEVLIILRKEKARGFDSEELSLTINTIRTARLWRREDVMLKKMISGLMVP
jgi:hypothetical protein